MYNQENIIKRENRKNMSSFGLKTGKKNEEKFGMIESELGRKIVHFHREKC